MVTGTTGVTGTYGSTQSTNSTGQLDKDAFLKLLLTQLSNQDPLKPMDDTQFISQLAQFSSLEQMQQLNTNFGPFFQNFDTFAANQTATSLISKTITAVDPNPPKNATGHLVNPMTDANGVPLKDSDGNEIPISIVGQVQAIKFTSDGPMAVMTVSQKQYDSGTGQTVTRDVVKEIPVANVTKITE
jgi:flagellar basal-body rod modification protein FlgD